MTRTETKGELKRTTTTKQNTTNSSYLVKEVTPQIFPLDTERFFFIYGCDIYSGCVFNRRWFNRFFLCSGMKIKFLLLTGIK